MAFEKRSLKSADGFEFAAWALPASGKTDGNLILLQEIFGVNSYMKHAMQRFADEGFNVLAPSMFDRKKPDFTSETLTSAEMMEGVGYARALGLEPAMMDIAACLSAFGGKACITGFCYGGSMAYFAACQMEGIQAAACYYGNQIPPAKHLSPLYPTIAHFGRNDAHIPMDGVEVFIRARPDVPTYVYDTGHGFARTGSDEFHAASDALAFQRSVDLFRQTIS